MKLKKILEWNTCNIITEEIKYRTENWNDFYDEKPPEGKIESDVFNDSDLLDFNYESLCESLTGFMQDLNQKDYYWCAEVNGFGWRELNGTAKPFKANNGKELLNHILPNCDCTFKIFKEGKGLAIQNYHHDNPTGNEWYHIWLVKPCIHCREPLENNKRRICDNCKIN